MNRSIVYCASAILLLGVLSAAGFRFLGKKVPEVDLKVYGIVKMADGIGRQSVELIQALKDEMTISFVPTRPVEFLDVPKSLHALLKGDWRRSKSRVVLFEDVLRLPGYSPWRKMANRESEEQIRIAYSMVESTRIPPEWVFILNSRFDLVAVPDAFLIDVYKRSGVTIPVVEVPLGLYLDPYFTAPLKKAAGMPMVFGNLSTAIQRKNHLTLIRGFAKAFGNSSAVCLRINYRYGEESVIQQVKEEIERLGLDNVHFTHLPLDNRAYLNFFKTLDCYATTSMAEGFSIQPREAMALGIPVIATDNTAQSTICTSGFVCSIPSRIEMPAVYPWGAVYGKRFACEVEDVAKAFLDVYHNYDAYLQKAHAGREWVRRYQFANLKNIYRSLVNPKRILLGSEDRVTDEYLMTCSQELYNKYVDCATLN